MTPSPVNNLAATLLAATPEQKQIQWSTAADKGRMTVDPFRLHQGAIGSGALIEINRDLSAKGKGTKVRFPIIGEFHHKGINGDTPFTEPAQYARDQLGNDEVLVDIKKFGYNASDYNKQELIVEEIINGAASKLGRQMGREFYQDAAMTMLHRAHASSNMVLGHYSVDQITDGDELDLATIRDATSLLANMGGQPARSKMDGKGGVINGYHVMPVTQAFNALKSDATVTGLFKDAGTHGESNPVFTGELYDLDGHVIQHFNPIDHSEAGPVSSPYAPRAYLGTAITSGSTAIDITGGRNATNGALTQIEYFRWFPRFAFKFLSGESLAVTANFWGSASTDYFYIKITNPRGETDAGKWCMYRVTTNDGNKLTIDRRLYSSTTGAGYATLGNVTYDPNVHTLAHPSGSLIQLCNANGKALCATPVFGAGGVRRAFGMYNNFRAMQTEQGIYDYTYLYSVAGHGLKHDLIGQTPGIANIIHTYTMKGWDR